MKVLVINCGSSSLKYQLLDMNDETIIAKGNYERIGEKSFLTHKVGNDKKEIVKPVETHKEALEQIIEQLLDKSYPAISNLQEISSIGHRVVHGGENFKDSVIIDDEVISHIEECSALAPIHNPAALIGIRACKEIMPRVPMVAVFDTAFHQTIPKERYIYSVPYRFYEKYKMRKYGFHGTSHSYVSKRVAELINKPIEDLKTVVCHLGQGASLCAIKGGKSVDTSMGLTPVAGIPMCARSGNLDPSVVTFMMEKEGLSIKEVEKLLNGESGAYGISGISKDFRDIEKAKMEGNERAKLALEHYCYVVAQYIAKYATSMNGIDVIAFTAGIGENQMSIRAKICSYLEWMGVKLDTNRNQASGEAEISAKDSKVLVWIVPTNEELVIARDTIRLTK